ncbi:MAG: hypothetical protein M3680_27950 [Myxococcota bacterium]|nr:hypothetical protein [Myxococcota bacterium]
MLCTGTQGADGATGANGPPATGGKAFNFRDEWRFGGVIDATLSGDRLPIGSTAATSGSR